MAPPDTHIKGAYHFLRACGRPEHSFHPFALDVPTTLKVRRDLDRMYDVREGCSSADRRTPAPRLAEKGQIGESMELLAPQKDMKPGPGSYNPVEAQHATDNYGKTYIRIGGGSGEGRIPKQRAPTPAERIYEKKKEAFAASIRAKDEKVPMRRPPQASFRPDKHVRTFAFAYPAHRGLKDRTVMEDEPVHIHVGKFRRPKKGRHSAHISVSSTVTETPGARMPQAPTARPTGPGCFSETKRRTLSKYYFNIGTWPTASEGVDVPEEASEKSRAKHVPRVAIGRTSGRQRKNQSKDNVATLERMLKAVGAQQRKADRVACLGGDGAAAKPGCFDRKSRGVDLYLHGGRMEMAFQGASNTGGSEYENVPVRTVAAWAADEADCISRRAGASRANTPTQSLDARASAASTPTVSTVAGGYRAPMSPRVESTISKSVHGLQHVHRKRVQAAAAMDHEATLRAVDDPDAPLHAASEPVDAEDVAIDFESP